MPVRIGAPNAIGGLTDAMAAPQYATAIGLVLFGANGDRDDALRGGRRGHTWIESPAVAGGSLDLDYDTLLLRKEPKHG